MGANERRQAIWHTLCRCRHVTISYLAAEYKISRTTIVKDIEILSLSYPIETSRGNGGGVGLAEWYEPGKMHTPAQMDILFRISKTLTGTDAYIMHSIISQFFGPKKKR